jgi:hypothetical protein
MEGTCAIDAGNVHAEVPRPPVFSVWEHVIEERALHNSFLCVKVREVPCDIIEGRGAPTTDVQDITTHGESLNLVKMNATVHRVRADRWNCGPHGAGQQNDGQVG